MQIDYLDIVGLAERLHRQFLDVIQLELDREGVRDIKSAQALILHNIGATEMTTSELMWRGCYLGSNVSYNLRKLTEAGYVDQVRSAHDQRVIIVRASQKGARLCALLKNMNDRHDEALSFSSVKTENVAICRQILRDLQYFWNSSIETASLTNPARLAA